MKSDPAKRDDTKYYEFHRGCNTTKYTLAVFDMFRVFCKRNLNVS